MCESFYEGYIWFFSSLNYRGSIKRPPTGKLKDPNQMSQNEVHHELALPFPF